MFKQFFESGHQKMINADYKFPYIAIIILSLIALLPMPYGYYMFLRICVFLGASFAAYAGFGKKDILIWVLIAIAILFNPIIPIYLAKEIWMVLNICVAGLFGLMLYKNSKKDIL